MILSIKYKAVSTVLRGPTSWEFTHVGRRWLWPSAQPPQTVSHQSLSGLLVPCRVQPLLIYYVVSVPLTLPTIIKGKKLAKSGNVFPLSTMIYGSEQQFFTKCLKCVKKY